MTQDVIEVAEWSRIGPLEGTRLDAAARPLARALDEQGVLRVLDLAEGLVVESTSHVGSLPLGSLRITIHPKIRGAPLLTLLRYAYGLRNLTLFEGHRGQLERASFQDLLLHQLVVEVNELVARGLHRQYRRRDEWLASLRGQVDFGQLARVGGIVEATLPCRHHVRTEDCLPNRVLLAGLLGGTRLTGDLTLRATLRRTASLLQDGVRLEELGPETFRRLARERNRLIAAYAPALRIVELLFLGQGVATQGRTSDVRFPGFLFDMNAFFQRIVSRFLRDNLPDVEVRDEVRLKGMFAYVPGFNPGGSRAPVPRPDFVLLREARVVAVLDAKYRDLWLRPLPPHMLYQLAIYAMSQRVLRQSAMLYPTMARDASEARIEVRDPLRGERASIVALRPIHIGRLVELIDAARGTAADVERRGFARRLAFGAEVGTPSRVLPSSTGHRE